ncbi:MAG: peptidoglycan bridge formation glycyltransferase FemA/FemB family protein [bacterium]|nr:peptidoglycan bridge formation glycyltransferase FemA/FemB family protein [bacterium]
MEILTFTEETKQLYIDFVTEHESGSFLQSWSWGDFQTSQGKTAVRFGVMEHNKVVATAQLLITPIPHLPGFYLYSPYGPLVNKNLNEDLILTELISYIKEQYPPVWFIRIEPKQSLPLPGIATQRIQPSKTLLTDITQSDEELLGAMHNKTRYNIKVAAKHGVTIQKSTTQNIAEVVTLLTQTSDRQNYHSYPASYYENLISFFGVEEPDCTAHVYRALLNDELIATALMVDHGSTRTYLFGGSSNEHRSAMAPYALHWQAIQDAKSVGLTKYDWWGIETATGKLPGFVQFKLRWGGDPVAYPPAIDIVLKSGWYTVYTVLRKLNRLF